MTASCKISISYWPILIIDRNEEDPTVPRSLKVSVRGRRDGRPGFDLGG